MEIQTLSTRFNSNGYNVNVAATALHHKLDGGPGRFKADYESNTHEVTGSFTVNRANYDYLMSFYRVHKNGIPFLCNLVIDGSLPELYICRFIPGEFRVTGVQGYTYTISASLEVENKQVDTIFDENVLALINYYSGSTTSLVYLIETVLPLTKLFE